MLYKYHVEPQWQTHFQQIVESNASAAHMETTKIFLNTEVELPSQLQCHKPAPLAWQKKISHKN